MSVRDKSAPLKSQSERSLQLTADRCRSEPRNEMRRNSERPTYKPGTVRSSSFTSSSNNRKMLGPSSLSSGRGGRETSACASPMISTRSFNNKKLLSYELRIRLGSVELLVGRPAYLGRPCEARSITPEPACSKNPHNFVRRQGLIEEAGPRKTLIGPTCITPRQVADSAAGRIQPEKSPCGERSGAANRDLRGVTRQESLRSRWHSDRMFRFCHERDPLLCKCLSGQPACCHHPFWWIRSDAGGTNFISAVQPLLVDSLPKH